MVTDENAETPSNVLTDSAEREPPAPPTPLDPEPQPPRVGVLDAEDQQLYLEARRNAQNGDVAWAGVYASLSLVIQADLAVRKLEDIASALENLCDIEGCLQDIDTTLIAIENAILRQDEPSGPEA